jgi:pimeloyl-ACP methyl ester carboxylesterase
MKQSIIFLHGLFGGLSNWQDSVTFFKKDFNVRVPALPLYEEHGEQVLDYFLKTLHQYIVARGLENITLVGNSLGGHVAILYAHHYPEKVDRLVLTGSSGLYENYMTGSFPRRSDRKYVRRQVENVFFDPETASDQLVDEVLEVLADSRKCFKIIKVAKTTQRQHVRDILPVLRKPVLLVWGENDKITPPAVAEEFARLLPVSTLLFFSECGHAAMMEQPEKFNQAVAGFISGSGQTE